MLIKICGLTDAQTAYETALLGADYIGLLFSSVSKRKVKLGLAQDIAIMSRKGGAEIVGVFVDENFEEMLHIINELQLKIVQLHGDLVRSYCDKLPKHLQIIYVADGNALPSCLDVNKDFILFDKIEPVPTSLRFWVAGNLNSCNVQDYINKYSPNGVDVSSGVESILTKKDIHKVGDFIASVRKERYGHFGGRYVPELLITPLRALEHAYNTIAQSAMFKAEFAHYLKTYIGRPTPITEVESFAKEITKHLKLTDIPKILLKREDLLHTGAHKINNALGQCLLAGKMGKTRVIAETGAGQHGLATATACAMFGLECVIYMGSVDVKRQAPNVAKMKLLGAKVVPVNTGSATLKDAVNETLRDWAESYEYSHYCLGSALGPYPYPKMVADFQSVIGNETKEQMEKVYKVEPTVIIACIGGGSNSIGMFSAFLDNSNIKLIGVEAGGRGAGLGNNAARFSHGRIGVLHGTRTYVLQDENNQIVNTHSISAGLDYPAVGPQHAHLFSKGRVVYDSVTDDEALSAFKLLIKTEGIIPALESSHAVAYLIKHIEQFNSNDVILINLSGRGDKDLPQLLSATDELSVGV